MPTRQRASTASVLSAFIPVAALALTTAQPALSAPLVLEDPATQPTQGRALAQFAPRHKGSDREIDYTFWGEVLRGMVVGFGPSLRQGARRPDSYTGTRVLRGHKSRLRMEGNRIAYSFFTDNVTNMLTEYRADLEDVGSKLDIPSLPRNEQLAFWLNLHNVAIIEQIARHHPIVQPSSIQLDGVPLDEARFIEVGGVKLSLRDIRTRIVYPNWSDPRVIYGFHRGEIGGPNIQPEEFNARNLPALLDENAEEFINALRGTERRGKTLHVSTLYDEAAPFYFPNFETDLRTHIAAFANEKVSKELRKSQTIKATIYERDIADLARGQKQPYINNLSSPDQTSFKIPPNIQRYFAERREKIRRLEKRGERVWTIRIIPIDLPGQEKSNVEID